MEPLQETQSVLPGISEDDFAEAETDGVSYLQSLPESDQLYISLVEDGLSTEEKHGIMKKGWYYYMGSLHEQGVTRQSIAKLFKLSRSSITSYLRRQGYEFSESTSPSLSMRKLHQMTEYQRQSILVDYSLGYSLKTITTKYGITKHTLYYLLDSYGGSRRHTAEERRLDRLYNYLISEEVESLDQQENQVTLSNVTVSLNHDEEEDRNTLTVMVDSYEELEKLSVCFKTKEEK